MKKVSGWTFILFGTLFCFSFIGMSMSADSKGPNGLGLFYVGALFIYTGYELMKGVRPEKFIDKMLEFTAWFSLMVGLLINGIVVEEWLNEKSGFPIWGIIQTSFLIGIGIFIMTSVRKGLARKDTDAQNEMANRSSTTAGLYEVPPPPPGLPPKSSFESTISAPVAQNDLINLNSATEEEIAKLPGVGPILAKKAVSIRITQGGFRSVEHFAEVLDLKPHHTNRIKSLAVALPVQ